MFGQTERVNHRGRGRGIDKSTRFFFLIDGFDERAVIVEFSREIERIYNVGEY